ncbi:Cytochrome b5 domain-containing protein 1 [Penicillium chermesinum]|nr:Cytochrome b5 domain-containing protein 1 [Penicillium chermesinum]
MPRKNLIPFTPRETMEALQPSLMGSLDPADRSQIMSEEASAKSMKSGNVNALLNLDDIEQAATEVASKKAWGYYYSAADDKISKNLNSAVYRSILLRPRVFVDVADCTARTSFLGHKVNLPVFVAPAAQARLGHPAGEAGIAAACRAFGVAQIISNVASQSPEEIVADAAPDQVSEKMLQRINKLDAIKMIIITVDTPVLGNREDDQRRDIQGGVGRKTPNFIDTSVTWRETLGWLSKMTDKPVVIKGIQTYEDALLAAQYSYLVKGIILSNHGGRSLDTAPPAVHTLLEIRRYCPQVFQKIDVWVDGGIRRGTDVVKALCLGAKAVGIGRAPLWGLSAGGVQGVERVLQILSDEIHNCMCFLGVKTIDELSLKHVNTSMVEHQLYNESPDLDMEGSGSKAKL